MSNSSEKNSNRSKSKSDKTSIESTFTQKEEYSLVNPMSLLNKHDQDSFFDKKGKKLPPVHLWHPEFCGDIDMRIARDGRWFYQGTPIARQKMVELFSTILRHDDDGCFYLVTPVEKVRIVVEDAPFIAVSVGIRDAGDQQQLVFKTNVGDTVIAGPDHPLRIELDSETQEPRPYVRVRANLEALISRSVFYELVNIAIETEVDGQTVLGLWSDGAFYSLGQFES